MTTSTTKLDSSSTLNEEIKINNNLSGFSFKLDNSKLNNILEISSINKCENREFNFESNIIEPDYANPMEDALNQIERETKNYVTFNSENELAYNMLCCTPSKYQESLKKLQLFNLYKLQQIYENITNQRQPYPSRLYK